MPTLADIERAYIEIARRWGVEAKEMPYGTVPTDTGGRHLELSPDGRMALVGTERGHETKRLETRELDELLYWMFESAAHGRGWQYEIAHRHPINDSRRIAFAKALEEMARLSPAWRDRMEAELDAILVKHPFHDDMPS